MMSVVGWGRRVRAALHDRQVSRKRVVSSSTFGKGPGAQKAPAGQRPSRGGTARAAGGGRMPAPVRSQRVVKRLTPAMAVKDYDSKKQQKK